MSALRKTRGRWTMLATCSVLAFGVAGCGGDDFENEPRPPVAVDLTGVITEREVTISPANEGAGPIRITVSNQTDDAHKLTLEGDAVEETVGPIQPRDTATIQKTLPEGTYEVTANPDVDSGREIRPATLLIGPPRETSSGEVLLP